MQIVMEHRTALVVSSDRNSAPSRFNTPAAFPRPLARVYVFFPCHPGVKAHATAAAPCCGFFMPPVRRNVRADRRGAEWNVRGGEVL